MFKFTKILEVLFKMDAKTSTEGADRAAKIIALGVFVFFSCLGVAAVAWAVRWW